MRRKRSPTIPVLTQKPSSCRSCPIGVVRGYARRVQCGNTRAVATEGTLVAVTPSLGSHGPARDLYVSRFRWHFGSLALVVVRKSTRGREKSFQHPMEYLYTTNQTAAVPQIRGIVIRSGAPFVRTMTPAKNP